MSNLSLGTPTDVRAVRAAKPTKILFLECPQAARAEAERQLAATEFGVVWADSSAAAIAELRRHDMPVLVDFARGAATLHAIRELRTLMPDVLLFGVVDSGRADLAVEAVLAGVADILPNPLDGRRFARALDRESGYASYEVREAEPDVDELYCHSAAMRAVKALVAGAASGRAGVLVRGEHGTGREIVARAIHAASASTRPGAFAVVDCAAHDPERLDMELFGVAPRVEDGLPVRELERVSRSGRLFEALRGTLYLRNVADAPTRVQRRLARLLRDREAVLADTNDLVALDVRCIVGADVRFEAALQDGHVQEDLYRRLSATRIDVPPLRSRREDIPALANVFLREICAELRVPPKLFSRSALALLCALPWCGNAIELKALLRTIVSGLASRGIGVEDVLAHVRLESGSVMMSNGGTLRQARRHFEQQYIAAILQQHRGRITHAAKALGIQRTNLYRKMRTLGVAQPRSR